MTTPSPRHPIHIFHLEDFDINAQQYIDYLKPYFFTLEWDDYLYRQQQLSFLIQYALSHTSINDDLNTLFLKYYSGEVKENALNHLVQELKGEKLKNFQALKPTRRRAMQAFSLCCLQSNAEVVHIDQQEFIQQEGLTLDTVTDWRKIKRVFNSPPKQMITRELKEIIKALVKKLMQYHSDVVAINLFVHFTQIVAEPNKKATNSPEGMHQDGMDYIVSGLVIDRDNVCGGKSIIYDGDDVSKVLFETILKPNYGIFQPDKQTNLWHIVEPITPLDQTRPAYRSTIGIDFDLIFTH